jgi:hypothetical protein
MRDSFPLTEPVVFMTMFECERPRHLARRTTGDATGGASGWSRKECAGKAAQLIGLPNGAIE